MSLRIPLLGNRRNILDHEGVGLHVQQGAQTEASCVAAHVTGWGDGTPRPQRARASATGPTNAES